MNCAGAKAEADIFLRAFVGAPLTTETLNEIENRVNGLIANWAARGYMVRDDSGYIIAGIKLWKNPFDQSIQFVFRYPGDEDESED